MRLDRVITLGVALTFGLISICSNAQLSLKQQQFIKHLLPNIRTVDQRIARQHAKLEKFYMDFLAGKKINAQETLWLDQLSTRYALKPTQFTHKANWTALLKRVDVIPPSLILAQAANETAWGRSRFARLGNNYFGQICHRPGCGIVPKRRRPGARFEVTVYPNATSSVRSYLHNINTHRLYRQLRQLRYQQRLKRQPLNSVVLANGLHYYSERRGDYISDIVRLIKAKHLRRFDSNARSNGLQKSH